MVNDLWGVLLHEREPLAASAPSDRKRNFDVIYSARLQGTKIKVHIISSCLRALVAKLVF